MTHVAMLTSTAFWRRSRGSERRIADLTRVIAGAGHAVTAVWAGRLSIEDQAALLHEPVAIEQTGVPLPAPGWNAPLDAFASEDFHVALAGAMARTRPDTLIAQYIRFAPAVASLPIHLRPPDCLVDTHDVMHTRARAFREAGRDHWIELSRDDEAHALSAFDGVIAINDADARVLRSLTGDDRVLVVPHALGVPAERRRAPGAAAALFVGAAGTPNTDAAAWLIDEIWPLARPRLPEGARLLIAGAVCETLSPDQLGAPGVEPLGFTDDLGAVYAAARAAITPLRFGGGLKIKNVEALAHGLPVVTTPVGAQGLEHAAGRGLLVGCDPGSLVRVLTDDTLARTASDEAIGFIRRRFSPGAAHAPLLARLARFAEAAV